MNCAIVLAWPIGSIERFYLELIDDSLRHFRAEIVFIGYETLHEIIGTRL